MPDGNADRVPQGGMTAPDIAERYGVSVYGVTKGWIVEWRKDPDAPKPIGKDGYSNLYDPDAVERWVREHRTRSQEEPIFVRAPGGLLTAAEIAEEAGLSRETIRADLSRGRLTPKEGDGVKDGMKAWRRGNIADQLRKRRRRRAPKEQ